MDLSLFIVFIIGFCLGGLVGIDSPRQNTNAPPSTRPTRSTGGTKKTMKINNS